MPLSNEKWEKDKQCYTNITHKTKDRALQTSLIPGVNSGAPEGKSVSAPPVPLVVLILLQTNPVISHESMMVNIYFCSAFCAR